MNRFSGPCCLRQRCCHAGGVPDSTVLSCGMQWPVQGRNYQGAEAHRRWHSVDGGLCVVCGSCWHHSLKAGGCLARVCDWAGKRWAQHQPKPVLHHAGAHTMVGWQAHNLWPRVFRDDGCEEARLGQDRRTRQVRRRVVVVVAVVLTVCCVHDLLVFVSHRPLRTVKIVSAKVVV